MSKRVGRPKGKANKVLMAFRFRPQFQRMIARIAERENVTQARVIETALSRYGADLNLP